MKVAQSRLGVSSPTRPSPSTRAPGGFPSLHWVVEQGMGADGARIEVEGLSGGEAAPEDTVQIGLGADDGVAGVVADRHPMPGECKAAMGDRDLHQMPHDRTRARWADGQGRAQEGVLVRVVGGLPVGHLPALVGAAGDRLLAPQGPGLGPALGEQVLDGAEQGAVLGQVAVDDARRVPGRHPGEQTVVPQHAAVAALGDEEAQVLPLAWVEGPAPVSGLRDLARGLRCLAGHVDHALGVDRLVAQPGAGLTGLPQPVGRTRRGPALAGQVPGLVIVGAQGRARRPPRRSRAGPRATTPAPPGSRG